MKWRISLMPKPFGLKYTLYHYWNVFLFMLRRIEVVTDFYSAQNQQIYLLLSISSGPIFRYISLNYFYLIIYYWFQIFQFLSLLHYSAVLFLTEFIVNCLLSFFEASWYLSITFCATFTFNTLCTFSFHLEKFETGGFEQESTNSHDQCKI